MGERGVALRVRHLGNRDMYVVSSQGNNPIRFSGLLELEGIDAM